MYIITYGYEETKIYCNIYIHIYVYIYIYIYIHIYYGICIYPHCFECIPTASSQLSVTMCHQVRRGRGASGMGVSIFWSQISVKEICLCLDSLGIVQSESVFTSFSQFRMDERNLWTSAGTNHELTRFPPRMNASENNSEGWAARCEGQVFYLYLVISPSRLTFQHRLH